MGGAAVFQPSRLYNSRCCSDTPSAQSDTGGFRMTWWGWFIAGTFFVLGLVLVEFVFLALTIA